MIGANLETADSINRLDNSKLKDSCENKMELPDDSGKHSFRNDLPDDSGELIKDTADQEINLKEELCTSEFIQNSLETEKKQLTDEQKAEIKEETDWSDEIIDSIRSTKEYEIYKNADLKETEIDGKKCLIRSDIDWDQKDEMERTNKERVESKSPDGHLSPINKNGETVELHHVGQKSDSPLAELTKSEHIRNGNYSVLHDTQKAESEINRNDFNKEKRDYWIARAS